MDRIKAKAIAKPLDYSKQYRLNQDFQDYRMDRIKAKNCLNQDL